jgi:hypothetical protein
VDEDGEVTAVAEGTAEITATSTFDPTKSDTVTVTVVPAPAINSVTIDQGDGAVAVGIPFTFTVTVDAVGGADQSVTWTSSDEDVATVDPDSGAVTGVQLGGLATITATSNFDPSRTDSVQIFVADVVVTNGDDDGPGSLRQVFEDADPGSIIGFAPGVDQVVFTTVEFVPNHDAHLMIDKDITISGLPRERVVLSGDPTQPTVPVNPADPTGRSRILMTTATVTLQHLTITNGANIVHGAGIRNTGNLTLENVTIEGNVADFQGNTGFGGGILNTNTGVLTISDSVIQDNEAGSGGGVSNGGAGLDDTEREGGVVTITNSIISGNRVDFAGGGIYNNFRGEMTLNNVTVADNTADNPSNFNVGGGIFTGGEDLAYTGPDRARLVINGGLIDGNTSGDYGGGIAVGRNGFLAINDDNGGPTTISNNTALESAPAGGGIIVYSRTGDDNYDFDPNDPNDVIFSGNIPDDFHRAVDIGPASLPVPEEVLPQQFDVR